MSVEFVEFSHTVFPFEANNMFLFRGKDRKVLKQLQNAISACRNRDAKLGHPTRQLSNQVPMIGPGPALTISQSFTDIEARLNQLLTATA